MEVRVAHVPPGSDVRHALRSVGLFGEGSAVLESGRAVPLDAPIRSDCELTVVPTFTGG
ncbi:MAG: hypothetical protein L3J95_00555 [Thermoplasmata archaeon]|nr:hypothetical protein [Thermoplasmata archaeon]MCI4358909.1 hypothetical protein [Thermoplasmata archaeon]